MIKSVKFVSVPVRDQERALAFYTERLGFQVVTDQPFRVPGADTKVVLFNMGPEWEAMIGKAMNFSYAVDNVDRTYQELVAKGVEFEGPVQEEPWGKFAIFKDSEGSRFVLGSK
jgi:catechol 2,3-dioxygenase-like lactoylglutathione lyase family enzyme